MKRKGGSATFYLFSYFPLSLPQTSPNSWLSIVPTCCQVNFIHPSASTRGHIWCLLRHNHPVIPGSHLQPSPGWQSRCDLSYLLYCLFILAISFPFLLILFHSLPSPPNSFSPVPSLSTSRIRLILPLSFSRLLSF